MYCSECGTQVPDDSVYCHECGARVASAETRDEQVAAPVAPAPLATADETERRPVDKPAPGAVSTPPARAGHTFIGVAAIAGAALAIIGSLLAWADLVIVTGNGFDIGYLTDPTDGEGKDGAIVLLMGLLAGGLAIHYFSGRKAGASVVILGLGVAMAAIAGYNMQQLVQDAQELCDEVEAWGSDCDAMDIVGEGIYLTIVGGAITAIAGLAGLAGTSAQPSRR